MLDVVVVTANACGNAARITDYLVRASLPQVRIVGAVVDRGSRRDRGRQLRRLRAWQRHGGVSYLVWRIYLQVHDLLRERRPRATYATCVDEIGRDFGFDVNFVSNINSDDAEKALRRLAPDLAVSIGNRLINERIFAIPRLGMINLHHGRLPEYRGGPPAFWELYDGARTMGVSVHRIDEKLDHGDLLAAGEVTVLPDDTPKELMERAYTIDYELVREVLEQLADGRVESKRVEMEGRVRTLPSRTELLTMQRRLNRRIGHEEFRRAELQPIPLHPKLASSEGGNRMRRTS